MSYQSPYTGAQVDNANEAANDPTYILMKSNMDVGTPIVCAVADTWYDVVPANVDVEAQGNITFNETTGELIYVGTNDIDFSVDLACSVDSSVVNTIVHIGIETNGTVDQGTVSSTKLESTTAVNSVNIASGFEAEENDSYKIQIKADKACTVDIFHLQTLMKQYKKYL